MLRTSFLIVLALSFSSCNAKKQDSRKAEKQQRPVVNEMSIDDQKAAAKTEFESLNSGFEKSIEELKASIGAAKSPDEKARLFAEENPLPDYLDNMMLLAKKYPQTSTAVDAVLVVYEKGQDSQSDSAMDYLLDNFCDRVNLGRIALSFHEKLPGRKIEGWYRKMIENAPSENDKSNAAYNFFTYFDQFTTFRGALDHSPELAKRIPSDQIEYIRGRDTEVRKELEELLQGLIDNHGTLKYRGGETYAVLAKNALFELQNLQLGDVAPELEGKDFDNAKFRLSDYRGKVVMLDFWGHWCPPCRAMYDHERDLVKKLADKPFVLIGINSDRDLDRIREVVRDENLTWRNFWNGPKGRGGPISKTWNVAAWPCVYLIDKDGVIRYKEVLGSDIDAGIEQLLAEMGHEVKLRNVD